MKIVAIIFLLFLFVNSEKNLIKSTCSPKINLKCGQSGLKRYTYYVYKELADIRPGCEGNEIINVEWSMLLSDKVVHSKEKSNDAEMVFTIPAKIAPPGNYTLKVVAIETGEGKASASCPLRYVPEPPVLIFKFGYTQYIVHAVPFWVDITESKFSMENQELITWSILCNYVKETQKECRSNTAVKCENTAKMHGLRFTGILHKCFVEAQFKATTWHEGKMISDSQIVTTRRLLNCKVEIICEKNCDKGGAQLSNPTIPIVLRLQPTVPCKPFSDWRPKWAVKDDKTIITEDKKILMSENKRLIIKEDALLHDRRVLVVANVPKEFIAWFTVRTTPKIESPSCKIRPEAGVSMETKFTINCQTDDEHLDDFGPFYYIYQVIDGKKRLVTSSASENIKIVLSAIKGQRMQQLIIEGRDLFYNSFSCSVNPVAVDEVKLDQDKIKEIIKEINKHTTAGDDLGPQLAGAMLNELKDSDLSESEIKKHEAKVMGAITKFHIDTMEEYEQVADLAKHFIYQDDMNSNYKKNLANLCKQLSHIEIKQLHKNIYVKYQEMNIRYQSQMNRDCADKLLEPNKEKTTPKPTESTTEHATVKPVLQEDYDDYYMPFGTSTEEQIKTAAREVVLNNGKAVSTTLASGQFTDERSNYTDTLIAKEEGKYMAFKNLDVGSMTVIPEKKFQNEGWNVVTAIISAYDRDILVPNSNLSSNVLEVNFFKNTTKMRNVDYIIQFPVLNETVPFDNFTVPPPAAGNAWWEVDRKMNVHRLYLMKLETCFVLFKLDKNTKLRVAVSVNQRPRMKHFTDETTSFIVDGKDRSTLGFHNPYARSNEDQLFYVAVYPHGDMLQDETSDAVPYEIQFVTVSCVTYNEVQHTWEVAETCEAKVSEDGEDTTVYCHCKGTSLHSIKFKAIEHRLDIQMDIEVEVTDFVNYVVVLHVLVVFASYAIALALIVKRRTKVFGRDKIYFLSDNLKNDLYCYMLVVRTGSYSASGTTANIMIQVYGTKGKSKPHVLNYPDPACKLLQQDGVDWLIMANANHLGDLTSINLWTDSIGLYPCWFCEDVTIFDLQTLQSYVFKVSTWFSAMAKHKTYMKIPITTDLTVKKELNITKNLRFHYKGKHTWNIFLRDDEDLLYHERLTVLLSMIYTCYVLNMLFIGAPNLTRTDAFNKGHFDFTYEDFGLAFASSFINSGVHLTLVYFLRNSEKATENAFVVAKKRFSYKLRKRLRYSLAVWIACSMAYLIVYGFWMTFQSIYFWIYTTIISLGFSIFLWENLFINIVAMVTSRFGYVEELSYNFKDIIIEVERQRQVLFRKFGEVLMRPYFKRHYHLMSPNQIYYLRHIITIREEVAILFKDMCLFVIFILLIYLIAIINHDNKIHESNRMMRRLTEQSLYGEKKIFLKDVNSVPQVYNYLEYVIIPSIHPHRWYGKWYANEPGLIADFNTKILGVVQLRQQRRQQICAAPYQLKDVPIHCTNEAPIFEEWEYDPGYDITSTIGRLKFYDGSGYKAYLGRTYKNSKLVLEILRKTKWIDINTAVLFIEFLTYNANMNMFNAVRIYMERSRSGKFINSCQISTFSVIYTSIYLEVLVAVLFFILVIVIIILLLKRFLLFLHTKAHYFKNIWNIVDILLVVFSLTLLVLFFIIKTQTLLLTNEIVQTDHNKFVNYFYLIKLVQVQTFIYAITLSLASLRLWKFLHFGMLFKVMERTILKAGSALAGLFLYQVCFYLMIVVFIYPMYGENMEEFKGCYQTLVTLFLTSINFHEHLNNIYTSIMQVYLYLIYSFHLLISVWFLNMYATTLMINLEESKVYYSNIPFMYSIQNYIVDVFTFYSEKLHQHLKSTRLHGGGVPAYEVDVDKMVYPKSTQHRYADVVVMDKQKMHLMRHIALMAMRNIRNYGTREELTEREFKIMGWIVVDLLRGYRHKEDKPTCGHIFFKQKDPITGRYRFVPDTKMLQIEMVVKKILAGKTEDLGMEQGHRDIIVHQTGDGARLQHLRECLDLIQTIVKHIVVIEYPRNRKSTV